MLFFGMFETKPKLCQHYLHKLATFCKLYDLVQTQLSELATLCGKFHLLKKNEHLVASEITPLTLVILLYPILAHVRNSIFLFSLFKEKDSATTQRHLLSDPSKLSTSLSV